MSRSNKNRTRQKNARKIRNLVFAIILLLASVSISYIYFTIERYSNVIFPGVSVQGVDLSGKTKEETIVILREKFGDAVLDKKIHIRTPKKTYTISYSELNSQYNIIETTDEALAYGKNLNIISKFKAISKPIRKDYELKFSYNNKPIDDVIKDIQKNINEAPKDASIQLLNGKFNITDSKKGMELESDKLRELIIKGINGIIEEDIEIDAPIKVLNPKIEDEALKSIDTRIASYSTGFTTSSQARSTNIDLSTKSINGKVLMPGDTFSFNEIVGERTKERGYQEAGVIVNQQLDSGVGGGICQVSSTLYNAVLQANIKTTERVHHTFPSTYVGIGLDATVDWGNIDFKFMNSYDYPILIEGYTKNKHLYFNIYSNSALAKRTYSISSEIYETVEPTTKYIDDPNLEEGKTEVVKKAYTGYRVKTFRNIYENGKFINKELVANDYYVPVNGIIKKGTKK
jgi:vancomycin resistance protein YoaR